MTNLHWATQYIGIPYKAGGFSRKDGVDCWGLVRMVLQEQKGIYMPTLSIGVIDANAEKEIRRCFVGWNKSDGQKEFDIVTMRNALGHHIGIVVRSSPRGPDILHCDRPQSNITNFATLKLLGYHHFRSWCHE